MNWTALAVLIATMPAIAFAKDSAKEVDNVLASYRGAKSVQATVKKTVANEAMGSEMKSQGKFFFSKGKMRLEMREPERTILVYDGRTVWFEQRSDDEHILVTKMPAVEMRKSNSLLAALFDKRDILKTFDLKKVKSEDSKKTFLFDAKDKKKSDVQSLEIGIKEKEISRISYMDQIENRVTLEFSDVSKGGVDKDKFSYRPPKNAEITVAK